MDCFIVVRNAGNAQVPKTSLRNRLECRFTCVNWNNILMDSIISIPNQPNINNCIGNLENHIHKVFASVRVPGEDFVYSASYDLYNKLDKYCEETTTHDPKPPLLIVGESGTGKSALLSNWLQRRERNAEKMRNASDEHIFWHAVGCSRQSMNVNSLIKRLITDLKKRFELIREVPKDQERLCWELPRFLDLASKKARSIIIIIDGLNRIVNNNDAEDGLTWLPLEFPPNVRVILSATNQPSLPTSTGPIHSVAHASKKENPTRSLDANSISEEQSLVSNQEASVDFSSNASNGIQSIKINNQIYSEKAKKSRILQELERRNLPSLALKPLGRVLCQSLVEEFIAKSVNNEFAARTVGPYMIEVSQHANEPGFIGYNKGGTANGDAEYLAGFLLYASQIQNLMEHPLGGTPLFLRLFLRCLQYALSRGYSLWHIWNDWLEATTVPELLKRILNTLEKGYICTKEQRKAAVEKTAESGGYITLLEQYPWHPSFLPYIEQAEVSEERNVIKSGGSDGFLMPGHDTNDRMGSQRNINSQVGLMSTSITPTVLSKKGASHGLHHSNLGHHTSRQSHGDYPNVPMAKSLTEIVLQNLSDQQWNNVSDQAEQRLEGAVRNARETIHRTLGGYGVGHSFLQDPSIKLKKNEKAPPPSIEVIEVSETQRQAVLDALVEKLRGQHDYTNTMAFTSKSKYTKDAHGFSVKKSSLATRPLGPHSDAFAIGKSASFDMISTLLAPSVSEAEGDDYRMMNNPFRKQSTIPKISESNDDLHFIKGRKSNAEAADDDANSIDGHSVTDSEAGSSLKEAKQTVEADVGQSQLIDDPPQLISIRRISSTRISLSGSIRSGKTSPTGFTEHSDPKGTTTTADAPIPNLTGLSRVPFSSSIGGSEDLPMVDDGMRDDPSNFFNKNKKGALSKLTPKIPFLRADSSPPGIGSSRPLSPPSPRLSRASSLRNVPIYKDDDVSETVSIEGSKFDPYEYMERLPLYLRGGVTVTGFDELLGNALALLFVSRQGLRESELWTMLARLQYRKEQTTTSNFISKEMKETNNEIIRQLAAKIVQSEGLLLEIFKSEDINITGYLTIKKITSGVRKLYPTTSRSEVLKVLDFIESVYSDPVPPHTVGAKLPLEQGGIVNVPLRYKVTSDQSGAKHDVEFIQYEKVLNIIRKLNRVYKFGDSIKLGVIAGIAGGPAGVLHVVDTHTKPTEKKGAKRFGPKTNGTDVEDEDYGNFQLPSDVGSTKLSPNPNINLTFQSSHEEHLENSPGEGVFSRDESADIPNNSNASLESAESLGPVIEESLLAVLCALGVLHSAENKVLILPSDSEPFRRVIYENYILHRGGGSLIYWHSQIIEYFQLEPISMRKCEELPWHLKICRKWHALKDTLTDLRTFELMYQIDLKDELMDYWLLLTEGPLPIQNSANDLPMKFPSSPGSKRRGLNQSPQRGDDHSVVTLTEESDDGKEARLLWEINQSRRLGISLAETRKRLFKNMLTPFDVVEEFNKSVESWVASEHPNATALHRIIHQISMFLIEFSKVTTVNPTFLRVGVDLACIQTFAVMTNPEIKAIVHSNLIAATTTATGLQLNGEGEKDATANLGLSSLSPSKLQVGGASSPKNFVSAMTDPSNPSNGLVVNTSTGKAAVSTKVVKYFDNNRKEVERLSFPTPPMIHGNLYAFLRWIWIQFPWLALRSATRVGLLQLNDNGDESVLQNDSVGRKTTDASPGTGLKVGKNKKAIGSDNDVTPLNGSLIDGDGFFGESVNNSDNERLLRIWKVKKIDPSVPVYTSSATRKLAAVKPRSTLSKSLERNVDVTLKAIYEELKGPSHKLRLTMGVGIGGQDKYRRRFEEEVERSKSIPFAYHGVKAMKTGSLFPTYDAMIKERNKSRMESELNDDESNSTNSRRGKLKPIKPISFSTILSNAAGSSVFNSAGVGGGIFLTELDDEIRRINNEEYLISHKIDRTGSTVIKNENDLEYETVLDRIARMKTVLNKLDIIKREKVKIITGLDNEVTLRKESDELLVMDVKNSELLIRSLNDRNIRMEQTAEEEAATYLGYMELARILKENPPYLESHVASLELELELADKQLSDLCTKRESLYNEAFRINTVKQKKLIEKIKYYQNAREEIAVKKKQVQREIKLIAAPSHALDDILGQYRIKLNHSRKKLGNTDRDDVSSHTQSVLQENVDGDIKITDPLMTFLNAIVKKVTYKTTILSTDSTLADVKKRISKDHDQIEEEEIKEKSIRIGNKKSRSSRRKIRNRNRNELLDDQQSLNSMDSDAESSLASDTSGKSHGSSLKKGSPSKLKLTSDLKFNAAARAARKKSTVASMKQAVRVKDEKGEEGEEDEDDNSSGMFYDRERLASLGLSAFPLLHRMELSKSRRAIQSQIFIEYLFSKTESTSADEFTERFQQGQKLLESLKNQQLLVDSRLSQLRIEHNALYATWSEISFSDGVKSNGRSSMGGQSNLKTKGSASVGSGVDDADTIGSLREGIPMENVNHHHIHRRGNQSLALANSKLAAALSGDGMAREGSDHSRNRETVENSTSELNEDDRYLDNRLFSKEVKCHQVQRQYDKAISLINDVRTAVSHIMNLLHINAKLLSSSLAKSQPPSLASPEDIAGCITWCEDRIMALNEALSMEANKPTGTNTTDESKSISQRQAELATLILNMQNQQNAKSNPNHIKSAIRKQMGGISRVLINSYDNQGSYTSATHEIVVPSVTKIDKLYDSKVSKLMVERDRRAELMETSFAFNAENSRNKADAQRFLKDGLNMKVTKDLSRKANLLMNKRTGRNAGYGLILEELLQQSYVPAGIEVSPSKLEGRQFQQEDISSRMTKNMVTDSSDAGDD